MAGHAAPTLLALAGSPYLRPPSGSAVGPLTDAISSLGSAGGTVLLGPGEYDLTGISASPISLPRNVSIVGVSAGPTSHVGYRDGSPYATNQGTRLLMPTGGSSPYFTINDNGLIAGVSMYAAGQTQATSPPTVSPAWVAMRGKNPTLRSVELLNPYFGIDINSTSSISTERPTVEHVTGQPLYLGLAIGDAGYGGIADCARLSDVHFNPWFSYPQNGTSVPATLYNWQQANATAYLFGDNDELIARGLFAYGYKVGIRCVVGTNGFTSRGTYGSIVGGGMDACITGVQVDQCQSQAGLRISDFGFVAAYGSTNVGIQVNGAGVVKVANSDFWGVGVTSHVVMAGSGTLSLSNCGFNAASSAAMVRATAGRVLLTGSDFAYSQAHVQGSGGKVNAVGGFANGGLQTSGTNVTSTGVVAY